MVSMSTKSRIARRSFLAMLGASGAAAFLAACAPATPTPQPKAPEATKPPAPTAAPPKAVELLYYWQQWWPDTGLKDLALIQAELDKITKERLNCIVKLSPIDYTVYDEKMKAKNASGEKYDLAFLAGTSLFWSQVENNVLLDITDLMPKYAPKFWKATNPVAWQATKVKGRIYACVHEGNWCQYWGPTLQKPLVEKYSFDFDNKLTNLEDLEPWLDAVKKGETALTVLWGDANGTGGFGPREYSHGKLRGLPGGVWITLGDASVKVRTTFEVPETRPAYALTKKWNQAGYYGKEPASSADMQSLFRALKYAGALWGAAHPMGEGTMQTWAAGKWRAKTLLERTFSVQNILGCCSIVNKQTVSPEASVGFLELKHGEKEVGRLIAFGIEGKHWVYKDKARGIIDFPAGMTKETSPYYTAAWPRIGNWVDALTFTEEESKGLGVMKADNAVAKAEAGFGFAPSNEPMKNELAQLDAVSKEYILLAIGMLDYEKALPEWENKAKQAGLDKVVAEYQKQLDAWKATQ